jgi:hypothetical protein
MGQLITARLFESYDLHGRPVREDVAAEDGDDEDGQGLDDLMADAAGDSDESESYRVKQDLLDAYREALDAGDDAMSDEYHRRLQQHFRNRGAGVDARPALRGPYLTSGEGGGDGSTRPRPTGSRESLAWSRRLKGQRSLTEARAAGRRADHWARRLLGG